MVTVDRDACMLCGGCASVCPYNCITVTDKDVLVVKCKNCGICVKFCPLGAIE